MHYFGRLKNMVFSNTPFRDGKNYVCWLLRTVHLNRIGFLKIMGIKTSFFVLERHKAIKKNKPMTLLAWLLVWLYKTK
jgi:hypothetical protein